MGFYNGFETKRKTGPLWAFFLVGLSGVLVGGLLFLFIYSWIVPPADNGSANNRGSALTENEANRERETSPFPEEHQYTRVVEATREVSPAVVGVGNYRYRTQFGETALEKAGSGSGVVISPQGYIITNHHVVERADKIEVIFEDGSAEAATLVGEDPVTDLAVLKVESDEELNHADFSGVETLYPGEVAIAIGNPLGMELQQTVTVGVVSATERQGRIPGSEYSYTFIQTDAAINEGNSGGPLVNIKGEIIGINAAKVGGAQVDGIGFAIPVGTVQRVVGDIMEHGRVLRPYLGVKVIDYSLVTNVHTDRGVYIDAVEPGSPAQEAGLLSGDVIREIDGHKIDFTAKLFDVLLLYYPEDEVEITVIREDREITLDTTLGEIRP